MYIPIWVAVIMSVPPFIAAVGAVWTSLKNHKALADIKTQNIELHLSMNSRLDQLLRAANAQGRQDERDDQAKK